MTVKFPRRTGYIFFFAFVALLFPFLLSTKVFAAPIVNATGATDNGSWFSIQQTAVVYVEAVGNPIAETRYSWGTDDMTDNCSSGGTLTDNAEVLNAPVGGSTLFLCSRDTVGEYSTWNGVYNWEITPPSAPDTMTLSIPTFVGDHFVSGSFITNDPSGSTDTGGSGLSSYSLSRCDDLALTVNCTVIASGVMGTGVTVSGANLPTDGNTMYYYWTATDNALNVSDKSAPEYVSMDTTGPEGTIMNESGNPTTTTTPTLSMIFYDAGVGITGAQMELSCDAINWSPLEAFASIKSDFNIKPAIETYGCGTTDGDRIIFVRFYDALGNASATDNTGTFTLAEATPTPTPTDTPTPTPTDTPIPTPTDNVTPTPTEIPSITPTDNVTPTPSEIPSITPTDNVTPTPSEIPTLTPTDNVTVTPTATITVTGTDNVTPIPQASSTPVVSKLPTTAFLGDNVDKVILGLLFVGLGLFMYFSGNYLVIGNLVWNKGGENFYKGGRNLFGDLNGGLSRILDSIMAFFDSVSVSFKKANVNFKVTINNIKLSLLKFKDQFSVGILEGYSKFTSGIKSIFTHTKKNIKKTVGSMSLSKKEKFENDLLRDD